ncbi:MULTISPECIES: phosphomannomutase [Enterobacter cloacae complex]|uniref:phosphomannomutase n=1 Tax=Enterobacter cloacae complex TaxID=354276 RepID=UPI001C39A499|nr:phosphomannomutase [Enterobacter cloacae]HBH6934165.1 phosphomannomutase [Enterobacter cloacae]HEI9733502.1 phosphomannomutase [Enterobacter cloacae]
MEKSKVLLNTKSVIANSNISFGTSGARGLVIDFRPEVCAAFASAFINVISAKFSFDTVYIAIDNRPSSYEIAQFCAQAVVNSGYKVAYQGVVPTPALAFCAMANNCPCIMVTGSHIPFDRNGLKFYRPDGEISKDDEETIIKCSANFEPVREPANLIKSNEATDAYITRYTSLFDNLPLKGKRIGIYEHSSAGRDLYSLIFKKLGAEVISLGRSDKFIPIDTEAVSEEDQELAKQWSQQFYLDAIFSTDGDGDRPLLSDEKGKWLRGDILGLLAAKALNIAALAVPVSCNTAIELSGSFNYICRTKIGSPYVIHEFKKLSSSFSSVAGFEANGGFLLASEMTIAGKKLASLPTRDAVLPVLMVLAFYSESSISELTKNLPCRYTWSDRIKNFPTASSAKLLQKIQESPDDFIKVLTSESLHCKYIDQIDGVRLTLSNDVILHLRPSGNAPELRCYIEAGDEAQARKYVEITISRLISLLDADEI